MMNECLKREFKRFEGQPVKIYTDDGRIIRGLDIEAFDNAVRIFDNHGRLMLVEYCHIDAVEEPQMQLRRCRCNNNNGCDNGNGNVSDYERDYDRDYDCDCDNGYDREYDSEYNRDNGQDNGSDCDCGCGCGRSRCC